MRPREGQIADALSKARGRPRLRSQLRPSFGELGLKNLDIDLYFWLAGPEEIAKQIAADVARWKKFIAETGIKAD